MAENVQKGPEEQLPHPSKERAAELYAAGWSVKGLARKFLTCERHMRRILASPEAVAVIKEVRDANIKAISGQTASLLRPANEALKKLIESDNEPVKLAAARAAHEIHLKLRAFEEFADRLRAIEDAMEGKGIQLPKPPRVAQ